MKYVLSIFSLAALSVSSQVNDTSKLDNNFVSATITDQGNFFNYSGSSVPRYEIPKGNGTGTIYQASLNIGAEDINGDVHFAGYTGNTNTNTLQSGPIANLAAYLSLAYTNEYGKAIWKVSKQSIDAHIQNFGSPGYIIPSSILNWPGNGLTNIGVAHDLAPYVDVNNDGAYTPDLGDYPDILGNEAVYVILNDKSYFSPSNSLGIEVHLMFYQYHPGNYMSNTIFLNIKAFNRSTTDYFNLKESLYIDFDIGNPHDDFIGCDSANHVAFGYNADNYDDPSTVIGYGIDPPCQGIVPLSHEMSSFGYISSQFNFPSNNSIDTTLWQYMNATWPNGTPWTYGGIGYDSTSTSLTNFIFNGNPYTGIGWNEIGTTAGGERRGIVTISETYFPAGTMTCADFAFIYDRSGDHLKNVQNVINIANSLRLLYQQGEYFTCNAGAVSLVEHENESFELYPNPANEFINLQFEDQKSRTIQILNLSGQILKEIYCDSQDIKIELDLESGKYFVIVKNGASLELRKFLIK